VSRYPWLCGRKVWVAGESYAGHFTVQLATAIAHAEEEEEAAAARVGAKSNASSRLLLCGATLGGVLVGNGVVDINQTNFAWFEAGYARSVVDEPTWSGMRAACDFTKDLGIDGNGA
jgi:hypothetical protein